MSKNELWCAEIERFGYTLRVYSKSEREARHALLAEYSEAYIDRNNVSPDSEGTRGEYYDRDEDKWYDARDNEIKRENVETYLDLINDEMYVRQIHLGEVYWE